MNNAKGLTEAVFVVKRKEGHAKRNYQGHKREQRQKRVDVVKSPLYSSQSVHF